MVVTAFGLPGSGKTTYYTKLAVDTSRDIDKGRTPYKIIVGNVALKNVPHYYQIDLDRLGVLGFPNALILIDEATLYADSRKWGVLPDHTIEAILLHRHWCNDMFWFSQIWNRVDKTIRDITEVVLYLHKDKIFPGITRITQINYGIIIPQQGQDRPGEIIMGYVAPSKFARFFEKRFFRFRYYKYFDSHERPNLPLFRCDEYGNL